MVSDAGQTLYNYAVNTGWLVHKHINPLLDRLAADRRRLGATSASREIGQWGGLVELAAKAYVRELPKLEGRQWWWVFPPRARGEAITLLREHFEENIRR